MIEAKIGKRFTLVIPKEIREDIGLQEGQKVLIEREGNGIRIEPLPVKPFDVLGKVLGKESYKEEWEEAAEEELLKEAGK